MNPFDEIVGSMRVESSLYVRLELRAPWGIRFRTGDQARLLVVPQGSCWLMRDGSPPLELASGACLIIKAGVDFVLADQPDRDIVRCETLVTRFDGGVVHHGGDGARTELVSGRFSFDPVAAEPLTALMPDLFHIALDADQTDLLRTTLRLMGLETARAGFGAGLVIDRLGDALFIQALRAFCLEQASASGWLAGLADRRLQRVIAAVHADLARDWTVEEMAEIAGRSRSSFAANFKAVVGEAPLDYLTGWRIYRAKVLLASSDTKLSRIAGLTGYDSDISLSHAFRRRVGVAPGQWRRKARGDRRLDTQPRGDTGQMQLADTIAEAQTEPALN